eukprot:scaffold1102_cov395-Prasinococcus_capsulatus_cf.AAC.4
MPAFRRQFLDAAVLLCSVTYCRSRQTQETMMACVGGSQAQSECLTRLLAAWVEAGEHASPFCQQGFCPQLSAARLR